HPHPSRRVEGPDHPACQGRTRATPGPPAGAVAIPNLETTTQYSGDYRSIASPIKIVKDLGRGTKNFDHRGRDNGRENAAGATRSAVATQAVYGSARRDWRAASAPRPRKSHSRHSVLELENSN